MVYIVLAFFILSFMGTVPVTAPALGENTQTPIFKDVTADNPNAVYIKYIVARGLITGFPDGSYHPAEALTRAQAAALLAKIAGLDTKATGNSGFKDVPATYWAAGSIAAASKAGYIKGMGNGQFQPNKKLTRAQGISLFLSLSKQADPGAALPALSDINSQHWAARPVAIALDAGMIGLSSDKKKFYPDAEFSRGDLARMLALLLTNDPDLSRSNLSANLVVKKGGVSLQTTGKTEAKTVSTSTAINPGDTVITGESGEAEINLPDGSGLLLKANTILTLKNNQGRSYIKKDGSIGSGVEVLEVELKQGRIFGALASRPGIDSQIAAVKDKTGYLVASLAAHFGLAAADKKVPWYKTAQNKKVKVKVDMPWGICGIRGSFWSNVVSATENSTSLLNGEAEVSAANKSQPLAPGQSTIITGAGQAPTPATAMSPDEQKAWEQEKTWVDQKQVQINQNQELIPIAPAMTEAPKISEEVPKATMAASFEYAIWYNGCQLRDDLDSIQIEVVKGPQNGRFDITKLVYKDDKGNKFTFKSKYTFVSPESWNADIGTCGYLSDHQLILIMLTREDSQAIRKNLTKTDGELIDGTLDAEAGWLVDMDTGKVAPATLDKSLRAEYAGGCGGM